MSIGALLAKAAQRGELTEVEMGWTADIVSEPTRNHELCVDLFEDGVHRARIERNDVGEVIFVSYGNPFAIPVEWLREVTERFVSEVIGTRLSGK